VKAVFVDTQCLVAFLNRRDRLHATATALVKQLRGHARFVTTDDVLTELLNFFAERGAAMRTATARVVEEWHPTAR
jgi:predicted nucleic acid-binding protein